MKPKISFGEAVKNWRDGHQMSQEEAVDLFIANGLKSCSVSTLSLWERGGNARERTRNKILSIMDDYDASMNNRSILATPKPTAYDLKTATEPKPSQILQGAIPVRPIPLFDLRILEPAKMLSALKDEQPYESAPIHLESVEFALRMNGTSMYPKYSDGDVLYCRMADLSEIEDDSGIFVVVTKESKRVRSISAGSNASTIKLRCLNRSTYDDGERIFPDIEIAKSNVIEIAKVIGAFTF